MTKLSDYNARAVGIAWLRKEDYAALIDIFEDGNVFDSWKQWEQRAEEMEKKFKADGYVVERVYIDPDTFPDWCSQHGLTTGRDGRSEFAASVVAEKYGRNQS